MKRIIHLSCLVLLLAGGVYILRMLLNRKDLINIDNFIPSPTETVKKKGILIHKIEKDDRIGLNTCIRLILQ